MVKKILVMTGSPRKGGNSDMLADAFIKGAESAGHEVTKFECAHKNIKPCIACDACYSQKGACVFNDDFNELAPLLEQSDVIVFAPPVYWFTFPAQMKGALIKCMRSDGGRQSAIHECSCLLRRMRDRSDFEGLIGSIKASPLPELGRLGHSAVPPYLRLGIF
jgi:hypothetical protein